jgi:hypothetical protein
VRPSCSSCSMGTSASEVDVSCTPSSMCATLLPACSQPVLAHMMVKHCGVL